MRGRRRRGLASGRLLIALAVVAATAAIVAMATGRSPSAARHRGSAVAAVSAPRMRPHGVKSAVAIDRTLAYTPFVSAGTPRRRVIALTFDDGPSPYTPKIIRVLLRLRVPTTFFVVGQQLKYFTAGLREEIRDGFVVGDHTENHAPLNRLNRRRQYDQIDAMAIRVRRLGAPFPRLFRPPYGYYNAVTFAILRRLHMLMVLWSVDPRDWTRPGTRAIVTRVLAAARPGAVVELHDGGGDRSETVAALPAIINGLRRRRFELVTVPRLLSIDPPARRQHLPQLSE